VATSILEQYRISDFLEWHEQGQLKLNPDFQRGRVWTTPARVYLIDTILRALPIPKVYLRTLVDLQTRTSFREVVDGQQRLRAIIDFSDGKFTLTKRAGEFAGLKYQDLDDELQEAFLTYPIAVDQLLNASDNEVIEIFSRLNSYTVSMNDPERRHARFQGSFKWSVHDMAQQWRELWERYRVVSTRQRVRMLDDSWMAEAYGVVLKGVTDGGQSRINGLYREYDGEFKEQKSVEGRVNETLKYIVENLDEVLVEEPLSRSPHFLMLFAAVAHALDGIPRGDMGSEMPRRRTTALRDAAVAERNLSIVNEVLSADEPPDILEDFWLASQSSTQRIASRRVRFRTLYEALSPRPIAE
jgi:hypothetical protein